MKVKIIKWIEFIASDDQFGGMKWQDQCQNTSSTASMMWHYNTKQAAALEMPWKISSKLNLHSPDQNGLILLQ